MAPKSSSTGRRLTYILALALIIAWFLTNAYLCYQHNKQYSDELSASYARFHTWSSPYLRSYLGALSPLPQPDLVKVWRSKIALALGYLYVILSLSVLAGLTKGPLYVLLALHVVQSLIFDNPATTITQGAYEGKVRAALFDVVIAAGLIMVSGIRGEAPEELEESEEALVGKARESA